MKSQLNEHPIINFNFFFLGNMSKFLSDNEKKNIINLLNHKNCKLNYCIDTDNDYIEHKILKSNVLKKYNLKIGKTKCFSFYSKNYDKNAFIKLIFGTIICYHYKKYHYFFFNLETKHNSSLIFKQKIIGNLYNLNETNSIFFVNDSFFITKFNFNYSKKEIIKIGKLNFPNLLFESFELCNQNTSIFLYNKDIYLIFLMQKIIVFKKKQKNLNFMKYINISFYRNIIPFIYNKKLYVLCNEKYFYMVNPFLIEFQIKKKFFIYDDDISLNYSNQFFTFFLFLFKLLLYYLLFILKINDSKLKFSKLIINIFEDYKINVYIKKFFQFINEDNYNFYLNTNIEDSKIKPIIIYILIYEQYDLLHKIYLKQNNSNLLVFKLFLKDFISGFFEDFKTKINVKFVYTKLKLIN